MLVLALSCAIPAISAAQDAGTTTNATTTTATTPVEPPTTSPVPTDPAHSTPPTGGGSGGAASGTPGEAPDQSRTGDASVADSPPADAPPGTPAAGGAKARKSASATVTMGDLFFSPASVTIAVGDTVTWHNTGQAPHNATANDGSFDTPNLTNGQSASHTFDQAGSFSYICTIHPQMKGTIRVLTANTGGGGGNGGGGGASSSSSSGSSSTESAAVASPGAAGDSNTLPMTGMAVGALALVGLGLLALGLIARQAERDRPRPRWFIF